MNQEQPKHSLGSVCHAHARGKPNAMKIAYFDCFAGASGDMILGALVDVGLAVEVLRSELLKLDLTGYELQAETVVKKGIGAIQVSILVDSGPQSHHHRHLHDIEKIIGSSELDPSVKENSIHIFRRLAAAEAKVHRTAIESVHFHEVGAVDAIVDVVGSAVGLHRLGIEKVLCSPIHLGSGTVDCAHGTLPVPAPATAELVKNIPVYSTGVKTELLTPTGAAILTTVAEGFGPMPAMTVERIGYGAGTSDPPIPNLLRVFIGETSDGADTGGHRHVGTALENTF
jgi:pyridinium-3,5-bisthiocarboxylic acid mononucleotide nickel chelatase